jgi:hypothetical protein
MGCTSSSIKTQRDFVLKPSHPRDVQIQGRLVPFLNITNPANVNLKYTHIMEIDEVNTIGTSIFKTHQYKCKIPKEELEKKRKEYWGFLKRYQNRRKRESMASIKKSSPEQRRRFF